MVISLSLSHFSYWSLAIGNLEMSKCHNTHKHNIKKKQQNEQQQQKRCTVSTLLKWSCEQQWNYIVIV